jgi:two-component system chemotaxis response regulator CheY
MLGVHGFEILEARDGMQALNLLEQTGPADAALVDWNMPEMNGLELLMQIRKNDDFARMRVVMVTTEMGIREVQAALDAGATDYLMKPFNAAQVNEKLALIGLPIHA